MIDDIALWFLPGNAGPSSCGMGKSSPFRALDAEAGPLVHVWQSWHELFVETRETNDIMCVVLKIFHQHVWEMLGTGARRGWRGS